MRSGGRKPPSKNRLTKTCSALKAMVRGYSYAVVPTSWFNRTEGVSKFKIKEMGSRYLFIVLYCYLEKLLAREDYRKRLDLRERQLQVWSR